MHPGSLHKTYEYDQTFSTYDPRQTGVCRIRIFEPESSGSTEKVVVIASQKPTSVASVTNFAESIARVVLRLYGMAKSVPPSTVEMVWIEHYPPGTLSTTKQERFSIVQFRQCPEGIFSDPKWQEVSRQHVERTVLHCDLS